MTEMTNDVFGGSWGWIILIFLFFLGFGNGFGGLGGTSNVNNDFLVRDLAGINQNISNQASATNMAIADSKYATLLGFKDAQYQQSQCCCELKTAVHAEGEATRQMIMEDRISALREALNTSVQAYNNLALKDAIVSELRSGCSCS